MNLEEYLGRLDPKTAKRVQTAEEVELIKYPLASIGITQALNGGIAAGRITLCYGNTSSGKSALFQQSIGEWQKQGLVCAYVDVEGTWEKSWAARLGVNNSELILIQSKNASRIEEEIKPHMENGIDIIIIDSISDIMADVFIKEGELNPLEKRKQTGAQAKAITGLCNGIHYLNERTAVVMISQTTTYIDAVLGYAKQIPHGGQKTQFSASQIIKLTSTATDSNQIKGELLVGGRVIDQPIGRKVKYLVEKNKLGRPFIAGEYNFYYAGDYVGVDTYAESVDLAESYGVVEKSGTTWYIYGDEKFQGKAKLVQMLKDDEEAFALFKKRIDAAMTGEVVEV